MSDKTDSSAKDGGIAVGAYLRYLRIAGNMTLVEIANIIGIDQSQVWRIEGWKSDTKSTALFKFIEAVKGSPEDVALLINNPNATVQDGETLARLRLSRNR